MNHYYFYTILKLNLKPKTKHVFKYQRVNKAKAVSGNRYKKISEFSDYF